MPKPLLALLAFSLICTQSYTQSDRVFTQAELREDLRFMKESIETYCPALGIFHRDTEFNRVYDSLYAGLAGEMSDLKFYPSAVRLAESTREGHMIVGSASDTTSAVFRGFYDGSFEFFPLSIREVDGEVHVWGNFSSDSSLQRGDQVLRINGEPIKSIIVDLGAYAITDGNIPGAERRKVIESFGSYYFWFCDKPEAFEITYQPYQSNEVKSIAIPAIHRDSMITWRNVRYGKPEETTPSRSDVYELHIEDGIAHLQLKNFSRRLMEQFKIKPRKLYKAIFRELREKNVQHLVLDVRGNTGGRDEYTEELLPYLMKKPYRGVLYEDISWKGKRDENPFPKQSRLVFAGKLYVLTDGKTFSNGSVVAQYARDFGEATIIGQETGSRYEGWAGGSRQSVTLPNTRIPVRIPRYLLLRNPDVLKQSVRNRGVIPDHPVSYTFEDLLEERDKAWEQVEALIGGEMADDK